MSTVEIGCACGATRVEIEGAPLVQFHCHCDDCRAVSGAPYVTVALFPRPALRVTQGRPDTFVYKTMQRRRCPHCGTMLFGEPPGLDICGIRADLLPPALFKPQFHIHCRLAVQPVEDGLPHYKSVPPQFGGTDEQVDW
jgi:hypothetical protein